jgi:hypothetical protein
MIKTSSTLQLATTPLEVAESTEAWDEVMPSDEKVLDFGFGGIYKDKAVRGVKQCLQTPWATTGVAISLARQSIHTSVGALEPSLN